MDEKKIARINELYHRSKAEGLKEAEKKEQAELRREYVESVRMNLRGQLNNIDVREQDGSITNLGEKYGKKGQSEDNTKRNTGVSGGSHRRADSQYES